MKFRYTKMNYGIVNDMLNSENRKQVLSNSILKHFDTNGKLRAGYKSANTTALTAFNMCFREPKIILDKNVVAQYFKSKRNANKSTTAYCNKTYLEGQNEIHVTSEKCEDYVKNTLSVKKSNKRILVKEKEVVLKEPIFSRNNNFFHNINEYITQQSNQIDSSQCYSNTLILENHCYKLQLCNENEYEENDNFINNKNIMYIKEEPVDMECGDDILYTNGSSHYNENVMTTKIEPIEMECGDDILFTNDTNYYQDAVTTLAESVELECGDDILFTNGGGYYNSDENTTEGNQDFICSYEDPQTNVLNNEIKQEIYIKNAKSPIIDTFEEKEDEFYCDKKCDFIKQELYSHVSFQCSNSLNENGFTICEKCGRMFESLSLLKKHQLESCGLKFFYTCKFCPSTSWYSNTLKNHIEIVHRRELDKENIDDIMETIKWSRQIENDRFDEENVKKQVLLTEAHQRTTKKSVKRQAQTKKKKIYINYNEIKRILNISCFECNKDPEYVRGKAEQYCSQCRNEYTFQCRKCSRFYFKYGTALTHAKGNCKKKISNKTLISNNQTKRMQEKRPNMLSNKPGTRKHFNTCCVICNELLEQSDCSIETICRNCNKASIRYQCDVCKQFFNVKTTAKRHSQMCHIRWREFLISSSLSTIALRDHNYYCKNRSEPRVNNIAKQTQQPQFAELRLSQQKPASRVYMGKKN